jgi:hypothetical protein
MSKVNIAGGFAKHRGYLRKSHRYQEFSVRVKSPRNYRTENPVQVELPLAYIGNASSIDASGSREIGSRRFRLSGKKEGAGAAVAVILVRRDYGY